MNDDDARLIGAYGPVSDRARRKQLPRLDVHGRRFIALSPFLVMSTGGRDGSFDASPRGGEPGFVRVLGDDRLLIPDAPGNNRLDSLRNIADTGGAGLIFFVPGVDETLRVNGRARLADAPELLAPFAADRRPPRLVIEITVREAYLHCAKALMRSRLWDPASLNERSVLPSINQMISDQIGIEGPVESQEAMVERFRRDL